MDWAEQVRESAQRALPPVEGELSVPGLVDGVEVIRDRWGVPHVYASNLPDLFLAQGFVVGSERLFQLDMILRAANGRLATMFGALVLPGDRFARLVGWNRAGVRLAADYDEDSAMMTSAFRAGVRAWLEQMPAAPVEYQVLDLAPEIPDDPAYWASATAYLAWSLSGNADRELVRAEIAERLGPDALRDLFPRSLASRVRSSPGGARPRPQPPRSCAQARPRRRGSGRTTGSWRARARRAGSRSSRTIRTSPSRRRRSGSSATSRRRDMRPGRGPSVRSGHRDR